MADESSSSTSEDEEVVASGWEKERFGLQCEGYSWSQTVHSVEVYLPKADGRSGKDYDVQFTPETLTVKLKGADKPVLEGKLWQKIKVGESLWMIEDEEDIFDGKPYLMLYLYKWIKRDLGTGKDATAGWWRSLFEGGPFLAAGTPPSAYYLTRDKKRTLE